MQNHAILFFHFYHADFQFSYTLRDIIPSMRGGARPLLLFWFILRLLILADFYNKNENLSRGFL